MIASTIAALNSFPKFALAQSLCAPVRVNLLSTNTDNERKENALYHDDIGPIRYRASMGRARSNQPLICSASSQQPAHSKENSHDQIL